jgi:hypothetical protein
MHWRRTGVTSLKRARRSQSAIVHYVSRDGGCHALPAQPRNPVSAGSNSRQPAATSSFGPAATDCTETPNARPIPLIQICDCIASSLSLSLFARDKEKLSVCKQGRHIDCARSLDAIAFESAFQDELRAPTQGHCRRNDRQRTGMVRFCDLRVFCSTDRSSLLPHEDAVEGSNPFARSNTSIVQPGEMGDRSYLRHG